MFPSSTPSIASSLRMTLGWRPIYKQASPKQYQSSPAHTQPRADDDDNNNRLHIASCSSEYTELTGILLETCVVSTWDVLQSTHQKKKVEENWRWLTAYNMRYAFIFSFKHQNLTFSFLFKGSVFSRHPTAGGWHCPIPGIDCREAFIIHQPIGQGLHDG